MSTAFDTNSSDCVLGSANIASTVASSVLLFAKFTAAGPAQIRPLFSVSDAGPVHSHSLYVDSSGNLTIAQASGSTATFAASGLPTPANPTITNWNCYGWTTGPAGAGSLIGYFRDNAASSLTSLSMTGIASFAASQIVLGQVAANGAGPAAEFAYFMEFDSILTPTQWLAQSFSPTPITTGGLTLRRYLALAAAASAGTDTSGNGFNLTISGSLTDGLSLPTFPGASGLLLANANNGGF